MRKLTGKILSLCFLFTLLFVNGVSIANSIEVNGIKSKANKSFDSDKKNTEAPSLIAELDELEEEEETESDKSNPDFLKNPFLLITDFIWINALPSLGNLIHHNYNLSVSYLPVSIYKFNCSFII